MNSHFLVSFALALMAVQLILLTLPVTPAVTLLKKEDKQALLDEHNYLRAHMANGKENGHPPGADIVLMEWDDRLSRTATRWAATCNMYHDTTDEREVGNITYTGQNMAFMGGLDKGVAHAVHVWWEEIDDWNPHTQLCATGRVCGHYEAAMWSRTNLVGCGMNSCKGRIHVVCNYAPGGLTSQPHPFQHGKACSACPHHFPKCHKGLCATIQQCSHPGITCTDSTVTNKPIGAIPAVNSQGIISRVVDTLPSAVKSH